jgi:hypothetical protein
VVSGKSNKMLSTADFVCVVSCLSVGCHEHVYHKIQWVEDKGKSDRYHRTGREGPKEEQRCSSTLSLTSALDQGGWLTPRLGRFTPRKGARYPIV